MTDDRTPSASHNENVEWQLAELVDTVAAEIDRAQDTLSLKSYARGLSFAIKKLSLDLEVKVRRTSDGKLLFRTVNAEQTSHTVIKLDFAQVLQSQLTTVRKPLDGQLSVASSVGLDILPEINAENLTALGLMSIYSMEDLERCTQTPQMIAELSRKTQIEEYRIRQWRQLPFITQVKPENILSDRIIFRIEGGNFGNQLVQNTQVWFQQTQLKIIDGSSTSLTAEMPSTLNPTGILWVKIGDWLTNVVKVTLELETKQVVPTLDSSIPIEDKTIVMSTSSLPPNSGNPAYFDLYPRDLIITPSNPEEGQTIEVIADLINQGNKDSGFFEVQWEVDGEKQDIQLHGLLKAQQQSKDNSIRRQFKLNAGYHFIGFTIDPEGKLCDINKAKRTLSKQILIKSKFRIFNW